MCILCGHACSIPPHFFLNRLCPMHWNPEARPLTISKNKSYLHHKRENSYGQAFSLLLGRHHTIALLTLKMHTHVWKGIKLCKYQLLSLFTLRAEYIFFSFQFHSWRWENCHVLRKTTSKKSLWYDVKGRSKILRDPKNRFSDRSCASVKV